ncbi:uncharacterized protein J7T54_000013 [Emericellopsis cladophorae]|uniref:Ribosome quality control complex subunit 2 n=1 Tax=Emericellopsis cladophorae TaxID=2686198 RepID=A0A9Q0BBM3_9HYPO|nr:uncharacterized protein J7T54_000013 [Emericellopsis cladophorae]KAI6778204.1 hypothetical protein J7T54_000013 [Emericellopsis cladophorae]
MKQRFSSLDVKVIAHELQQCLVSLRLSNIYDLSSKILLLKFAKPDNKKQLVVDTGFRTHLTEFGRTTAAAPSAFVARLRKCLKTRRLTSVSQVGTDRILEFTFSDGQYRLFLEFFASGNIILTDAELNILALSRNVAENEGGQESQRVGLKYSLENRQNYEGIPDLTKERVRTGLEKAAERTKAASAVAKKGKPKTGAELRKGLASFISETPPVLIEYTLLANGFEMATPISEILANESIFDELFKSLEEARKTVENITSGDKCKGYIFAKYRAAPSGDSAEASDRSNLLYEDFHPFLPQKLASDPEIKVLEYPDYNQTVDEFFSSLEGQKLESRLSDREATAKRRMEMAKQEQAKRIEDLQEAQASNFRKAEAIETNVQRVQEAMDAVNGLIAQGMDWVDISKLVEREKKKQNPVAAIIKTPLKLDENVITLSLAEEDFEEEEDEDPFETDDEDDEDGAPEKNKPAASVKAIEVDINLSLSPWSNAREYYEERRTYAVKEEKTQASSGKALKNTEAKIQDDLRKGLKQEKALLQPIRKMMWFEKFIWFISSDGYLVLGGKDATQNDMLYKRYLRKGDIYCHADLHGASSVIVKNNPKTPDAPIPPQTLSQAGSLSVCTSNAWDSKAGMGAWWVNADQVSKSAPTGEFLPQGSFMIRGTKNFLPPTQLLMGLGFVFRISEESKAKHVKHRLNGVDDGDASAGASRKKTDTEAAALEHPVVEPRSVEDDASDMGDKTADESDNGEEADEKRDNPLQEAGSKREEDKEDDDEDVDAAEEGVQDLQIGADKQEAEESKDEGRDDKEVSSPEDAATPSVPETSETPTQASGQQQAGNKSKQPQQPVRKRGQKAKAKKIAAKYKYQDEEDRLAAEALIGAKAGQEKAQAEAKAKAEREAEIAFQRERRRAQHRKTQKETAEHEELRKVMMEEGVELLDDDEAQKATSLDELVGTPLPGDEILEVIPVCAPWGALGRYKYKAKLQPGSTKKGKAVKEILERIKFESGKKGAVDPQGKDSDKMWPREVELLKGIKAEEVVNSIPVGKVRVMLPGATGGGKGGGNAKAKKRGGKK